MTTLVFVRRFLGDYVPNPVNLLLAVVPVAFVIVVAGAMADTAFLLGGPGGPAVETATAGWAAAFLARIAMYFQTSAIRDVDRRVVIAGLSATRLVAARLLTGATLALFASAVALVALAPRARCCTRNRPRCPGCCPATAAPACSSTEPSPPASTKPPRS
jgi:hypothetical protein